MASSPPIGMARTEYVNMLEEERINLNNYQGKRYPIHGMCPISSFISVKGMYCNPRCTLFPHLVFFP